MDMERGEEPARLPAEPVNGFGEKNLIVLGASGLAWAWKVFTTLFLRMTGLVDFTDPDSIEAVLICGIISTISSFELLSSLVWVSSFVGVLGDGTETSLALSITFPCITLLSPVPIS